MKTAAEYLEEANKVVTRISAEEALVKYNDKAGVFIDVRDTSDIEKTGTLPDALRIPRGFIEFAADSNMPMHNEALKKDAAIYLICGLGGQAALAGKTLQEMGFENVTNIGGIGDWQKAGGPITK